MKTGLKWFAVVVLGVCVGAGTAASAQEKPVPPPAQDKAAAADPVTGEWEGAVERPDGATPFSMKLKLEKDKVTGEIGGPQGVAAITDASFVDGKLSISFTYVDGNAIAMTGTVADGQIAGSLNYGGGQMLMNWSAKKKSAK